MRIGNRRTGNMRTRNRQIRNRRTGKRGQGAGVEGKGEKRTGKQGTREKGAGGHGPQGGEQEDQVQGDIKPVIWIPIQIRTNPHKEIPPGSGSAWTDPDPGGKKAQKMNSFNR